MTRIKFCGIMSPEDIASVNDVGPDYIGFVFAEGSPRYISPDTAQSLSEGLSDSIPIFGVFHNESIENILTTAGMGFLDAIQLHGDESNRFIRMLRSVSGLTVVKAYTVDSPADLEEAYASEADMVLFDSGAGTGKTFDWSLLLDFDREYILAGGLDSENVAGAIRDLHPAVVDTSSGIETNRMKDRDKMIKFKKAVEKADSLYREELR